MTPGEALGRALRGLGVPDRQIPAEEEEQAALYRSLLAGRRMLVVLDRLLPGGTGYTPAARRPAQTASRKLDARETGQHDAEFQEVTR
jgi:hypothetical protein